MLIKKKSECSGEILILSLNRPNKRNALNVQLLKELLQKINSMDSKVRVLILKGEGSIFCAGIDLKEAMDESTASPLIRHLSTLYQLLYTLPVVTIAAVQGAAMAGGAGLAAACDITVAAEEAFFGFPEVRRGLVAALVLTLLRRQLSERTIRELLLIGEPIDATKALYIGLVNHRVPLEILSEESMRIAKLALKGSPEAIVETKKFIEDLRSTSIDQELKQALIYNKQARTHRAAEEGINAFLEKRAPVWCNKEK